MAKLRHYSIRERNSEIVKLASKPFLNEEETCLKQELVEQALEEQAWEGEESVTISIPVEIKYVEVPVEKIVYVDKPVDVLVTKEVIKEVEKIVYVDKPVEVIKEVESLTIRDVVQEKIVEVEKVLLQNKVPMWVWSIVSIETLIILALLIK